MQDMPVMYHVDCIIRGLRKRFKAMPLLVRIVLVSLALYVLSSMVNMLVQVVILSMNWVYTILGIIASIIIIYEFFIKRQQKKPR
jgi:amino acid transporter